MIFLRSTLGLAAALALVAPASGVDRPNAVVFLIDNLEWTDPG